MNKAFISSLFLLSVFASSAKAYDAVVLYEHYDYTGESLLLYVNEGYDNLDHVGLGFFNDWNDTVSSIAVYGNVVVRLFAAANYGGDYIDIYVSDSDLRFTDYGNWNDRVSSLWVYPVESSGWVLDNTLQSYVFLDGDWLYHESALGWLWSGGYYDSYYGEGWLYDSYYGWMFTDAAYYPWFYRPDGTLIYYEHNSANPRYFWTGYFWEESYN